MDHGGRTGRKRRRGGEKSSTPELSSYKSTQRQRTAELITAPVMNPAAMSLADKIALTLQGAASWQQLQEKTTVSSGKENGHVGPEVEMPIAEVGGIEVSPEVLAAKAKSDKKTQRIRQEIKADTGELLETIVLDTIAPIPEEVTWDQDPELVCCYNWQGPANRDDRTNTIYVPGGPAKYHQPSLPHNLDRDTGFQYTDYNYARQPRDPYSPMFRALSIMNTDYQFNNIDVLADRNNLRTLLEFTQGKPNTPFRLNCHLVHNTLVIVRQESRWYRRSDGNSYGSNFERFFTRPATGMEDAESHYRAIKYSMGPLNVVCRFEADAYDDGIISDELTQSEAMAVSGGPAERPIHNFTAPIHTLQMGHIIPTAQMVELKTQARKPDEYRLVQCQDQLWFGRTSLLFTAPYDKETGLINNVKKENAMERIKIWEDIQQVPLKKLVTLLTRIRDVLKRERQANRAVVLLRETKDGPLTVWNTTKKTYAVNHMIRQKHWTLPHQQAGSYRGQGGGARGAYNPSPGRGQFVSQPGPGQFGLPHGFPQVFNPRGEGQFNPRGGGHFNPRGGGQFNPRGGGHFNPPGGRDPSYAPRGGGYTERRRRPDYGRGGRDPTEQRRSPDYGRGGRGPTERTDSNDGHLGYYN